ncbi:MAG: DUF4401 domain-containing protein [Pseudomonadota bacterium]
MSIVTRAELWQRLQAQALVDGELPPQRNTQSPWYVRVMLGVAGWIGAMFLLGFVGAVFAAVTHSAAAALVVGIGCCTGAFLVFRAARDNDFGAQFGLAASLAGQALIAYGIFSAFRQESSAVFFLICLVEIALAVLMPNFIHRVLSSWAAMIAFFLGLTMLHLHGIAPGIAGAGVACIWLNEARWIARDAMWRPTGYGLTLALLQVDAMPLLHGLGWSPSSADNGWLYLHASQVGTALVALVLLATVTRLLSRQGYAAGSGIGIASFAATAALVAVSFFAPGLATALLVLLLGFAAGNRVLMGLGLLALGGFLAHYYYQLQQTLLVKSMVLAVSGALLLCARAVLKQWLGPITGIEPALREGDIHA